MFQKDFQDKLLQRQKELDLDRKHREERMEKLKERLQREKREVRKECNQELARSAEILKMRTTENERAEKALEDHYERMLQEKDERYEHILQKKEEEQHLAHKKWLSRELGVREEGEKRLLEERAKHYQHERELSVCKLKIDAQEKEMQKLRVTESSKDEHRGSLEQSVSQVTPVGRTSTPVADLGSERTDRLAKVVHRLAPQARYPAVNYGAGVDASSIHPETVGIVLREPPVITRNPGGSSQDARVSPLQGGPRNYPVANGGYQPTGLPAANQHPAAQFSGCPEARGYHGHQDPYQGYTPHPYQYPAGAPSTRYNPSPYGPLDTTRSHHQGYDHNQLVQHSSGTRNQPTRDYRQDLGQGDSPYRQRNDYGYDANLNGDGRREQRSRSGSRSFMQEGYRRDPKLTEYTGKVPWRAYETQLNVIADRYAWNSEEKLDKLVQALKEQALIFYSSQPTSVRHSYRRLSEKLNSRFGPKEPPRTAKREMNKIEQLPEEKLEEFAERVQRAANDAWGDYSDDVATMVALDTFLTKCEDRECARVVMDKEPEDMDEALRFMRKAISDKKVLYGAKALRVKAVQFANSPQKETPPTDGVQDLRKQVEAQAQTMNKILGLLQNRNSPRRGGTACWTCGKEGHFANECSTSPRSRLPNRGGSPSRWSPSSKRPPVRSSGDISSVAQTSQDRESPRDRNLKA
jgi:uncharacterized protein (DUF1697 family)